MDGTRVASTIRASSAGLSASSYDLEPWGAEEGCRYTRTNPIAKCSGLHCVRERGRLQLPRWEGKLAALGSSTYRLISVCYTPASYISGTRGGVARSEHEWGVISGKYINVGNQNKQTTVACTGNLRVHLGLMD